MEGTNNTANWENPGSLSLGFSAIFEKFESFEGHETQLLFETASLSLLNNFQLSERRPCSRNGRSCNLKEIFLLQNSFHSAQRTSLEPLDFYAKRLNQYGES